MLEITGLNVFYGESRVVKNVDLQVRKSQVICLMGRNGVGKTTLLKGVMGILPARGGSIKLDGIEITKKAPYTRARMGVGYVPQGRDILPNLTVLENLMIGMEASTKDDRALPTRVFDLFPILKEMVKRRGGDLSGGQQQQLAIARALVSDPLLLVLDEPTEGIQPSIIKEIVAVIKEIKRQGNKTILLVEQYVGFVRDVADYFYVMENGSIAAQGGIHELTNELIHKHLVV